MRSVFVLLAILLPIAANCASYFKDGMKWVVEYYGTQQPNGVFSQKTYSLEGDSIINDIKALKMYVSSDDLDSGKELVSIIHEEDDKVLFWDSYTQNWYLMYDFNLEEGEGCDAYDPKSCKSGSTPTSSYIKCSAFQDDVFNRLSALDVEEYKSIGDNFLLGQGLWIKGIGSSKGVLENIGFDYDGGNSILAEASYCGDIIYKNGESRINSVESIPYKIGVNDTGITISGSGNIGKLTIHAVDGVFVGEYNVSGSVATIPLQHKGIYIISINNFIAKICFYR